MNEKEFYDFLQKQRDSEDEEKQLEGAGQRFYGRQMMKLVGVQAANKNMTVPKFVEWMAKKYPDYPKLIEQWNEWAK